MWILPSVKSRMRGSDRIGRRPEPAATAPAALAIVLAVVVADDVAVLAQLHVRVVDRPGRREAARRRHGATIAKGRSHLRGGLREYPRFWDFNRAFTMAVHRYPHRSTQR